jgi:hypothetical protein
MLIVLSILFELDIRCAVRMQIVCALMDLFEDSRAIESSVNRALEMTSGKPAAGKSNQPPGMLFDGDHNWAT